MNSNSFNLISSYKALLFMILVSLMTGTSLGKYKMSTKDFFAFYDKSNQVTKAKLNFLNGDWYMFESNGENHDDRIFEFHPNNAGLLKLKNKADCPDNLYLDSQQQVLIFYRNQKPIFGRSILGNLKTKLVPLQKNKTNYDLDFSEILKTHPDLINLMNQIPFFTINPFNEKTLRLLNFGDLLERETDPVQYSEMAQTYKAEYPEEKKNVFMNQMIRFVFLFSTRAQDNSTPPHYNLLDFTKSAFLRTHKEQDIDGYVNFIYKDAIIQDFLSKLLDLSEFFHHKFLRNYFFVDPKQFLNSLFKNFDARASLEDLFKNNLTKVDSLKINHQEMMSNLKAEPAFDKDPAFESDTSNYSNFTIVNQYFSNKIEEIKKLFESLYTRIKTMLQSKSITTHDYDLVMRLTKFPEWPCYIIMSIFGNNFLDTMLSKYTENVLKAFPNVPVLKEMGFNDVSKGQDLLTLRKYLVLFGFVEIDMVHSDVDSIVYKSSSIFTSGMFRRRNRRNRRGRRVRRRLAKVSRRII